MRIQDRTKTPLQRRLLRAKITYPVVAREADVSPFMVWAVLNGRRVSANVLAAAKRLLDAARVTPRA